MSAYSQKSLVGRIVLVQEARFRLVDEEGRSFLFMLSHKTTVGQEDLQRWQDAAARVAVAYEGEPNLSSGIAHAVREMGK